MCSLIKAEARREVQLRYKKIVLNFILEDFSLSVLSQV